MVTGGENGKKRGACASPTGLLLFSPNSQFLIDLLGPVELFVCHDNIESLESLHFLVHHNTFVGNFCSRTGYLSQTLSLSPPRSLSQCCYTAVFMSSPKSSS